MASPSFETIEAQASYGIGLQFGQQLREFGLHGLIPEALLAGITDVLAENPAAIPVDVIHRALREMYQRADAAQRDRERQMAKQGEIYLQTNAQRHDVQSTESGLQFRIITPGTGKIPSRQDRVQVHYTGRLTDGNIFDSTKTRDNGQPAEFPVNGVISGWGEALTMMPVGSCWELTIPHQLAYGKQGAGTSVPPFSTLIFEVELLDII